MVVWCKDMSNIKELVYLCACPCVFNTLTQEVEKVQKGKKKDKPKPKPNAKVGD